MRIKFEQHIRETRDDLMSWERELRGKTTVPRVQMLRLLKEGRVGSLRECAELLGFSTRQVSRWWSTYLAEGIEGLIELKPKTGKPSRLTEEALEALHHEVRAGRISRLEDARQYLWQVWDIEYRTINGVWWHLRKNGIQLRAS